MVNMGIPFAHFAYKWETRQMKKIESNMKYKIVRNKIYIII